MIGIILWSDPTDQKAVIWCEDQGDLAYVSGHESVSGQGHLLDVGDVVEFDIETQRNMRLALNPRKVRQGNTGTTLSDHLRSVPLVPEHVVSNTAQVIPFRPEPVQPVLARAAGLEKRHG